MKNWLQKTPRKAAAKAGRNLPATRPAGQVPFSGPAPAQAPVPKILPPATIVYGAAAGGFFAASLLLLFGRHWLDALLTFIPGLIFVGFAVHLMKHGQPQN